MGLFSRTTKTAKKTSTKKAASATTIVLPKDASGTLHDVIRAPWLSEKALIGTEHGVYVFAVPPEATGRDIALAVAKLYGVTPRKVNVVNLPAKKKTLRTRRGVGTRARRHKAYVYLKKGDTLQFA